MEALEDAILNLVRLGLEGETPSIERYANRLLRQAKVGARDGDAFRRALSEVLVSHASSRAITPRRGDPKWSSAEPVDVARIEASPKSAAPILSEKASAAIDRLIRERMNVAALLDAGLEPTRSLLLVGPPGVGKTMTASYVASRLGVPLISLDLVTVMSSLLGQSGQNIRRAVDYARSTPCVFLLDEVDAIAKRRDDVSDVGELKRIVNLLLLELDRWPATGLLIAATNHPELLDRAIWRRFDLVLELGLPDEVMRRRLVEEALVRYGTEAPKPLIDFVAKATPSASGSDISMLIRSAVRERVLANQPLDVVLRRDAVLHLAQAGSGSEELRNLFCQVAHEELHMSHRDIGVLIGVSHVTVGNILKSASLGGKRGRQSTAPLSKAKPSRRKG